MRVHQYTLRCVSVSTSLSTIFCTLPILISNVFILIYILLYMRVSLCTFSASIARKVERLYATIYHTDLLKKINTTNLNGDSFLIVQGYE